MRLDRLVPLVILAALGAPGRAAAQVLPERPLTLADGQVSVSGEVTASIGQRNDPGFFNYTDYEHNALRMLRLSLQLKF